MPILSIPSYEEARQRIALRYADDPSTIAQPLLIDSTTGNIQNVHDISVTQRESRSCTVLTEEAQLDTGEISMESQIAFETHTHGLHNKFQFDDDSCPSVDLTASTVRNDSSSGGSGLGSGRNADELHAYQTFLKVKVRNRMHGFKTYTQCFVGKEAVDLLLSSGCADSRVEAVEIGRNLANEYNLFEHVCGDHKFQDDYLFYSFKDVNLIINANSVDGESTESSACRSSVRSDNTFPPVDTNVLFEDNESPAKSFFNEGRTSYSRGNGKKNFSDLHAVQTLLKVEVRDRLYMLKTYRQCFVGREAVDLLVSSGCAESRIEAIKIGRKIANECNLFEHVCGDHEFKDDYLFYHFNELNKNETNTVNIEEVSGPSTEVVRNEVLDLRAFKALLFHVDVRDRRYKMKKYKQCFVGNEAVDVLISLGCAYSRVDAVSISQRLAKDCDLFEHVCGDHDFKDGYFFYRFKTEGN